VEPVHHRRLGRTDGLVGEGAIDARTPPVAVPAAATAVARRTSSDRVKRCGVNDSHQFAQRIVDASLIAINEHVAVRERDQVGAGS
jgi:hypothetical protein